MMKKITLFFAFFGLMIGTLNAQTPIFELDFAGLDPSPTDFLNAIPGNGFTQTGGTINANSWGGSQTIRIFTETSITYTATGLEPGNYILSADIANQAAAAPWVQGYWATGETEPTPITQSIGDAFETQEINITISEAGDYTFGIIRGSESPNHQFHVRKWSLIKVPSPENDILTFELDEQTGPATIDTENHTVAIEVLPGTDVSALTPTITVSDNATIDPGSGEEGNFSNTATYTVTAESNSNQAWDIIVTVAINTENDILSFDLDEKISDAVIDAENHTVVIDVASDTDITALTPTVTASFGATILPNSGIEVDFTNGVTYTIIAEDGSIQDWEATVLIDGQTASTNEFKELSSSVYPNPATDTVFFSNDVKTESYKVMSISGALIKETRATGSLDVSDLAPGLYLIITDAGTARLIKQ